MWGNVVCPTFHLVTDDITITLFILNNAVVTCEIKLFQNHFSLGRRPSEINLFQRVEACPELFRNHFTGLLQLIVAEIILK